MKYTTAIAATLAAGASAAIAPVWSSAEGSDWSGAGWSSAEGGDWVTKVVPTFETYCAGPTSFTHGGIPYTVTAPGTVTLTHGPYTISYPATAWSSYSTPAAPVVPPTTYAVPTTPAAPVVPAPPAPTYPVPGNTTVPAGPSAPSVAPSKSSPVSPIFTGAANKAIAASGAGLAAIFGFVAYAL